MTRFSLRRRRFALPLAVRIATLALLAAPAPASAMQILDAADHAELAAEISATGVNRIALTGDRIARVVRAPDGFAVEHDAASGDIYLRSAHPTRPAEGFGHEPVTLFIGTERGFTYRLTLIPADRGSAQILIRNADTAAPAAQGPAPSGDPRIAALVGLVRAVARREALPGYEIHAGGDPTGRDAASGLSLIETWRGRRLAAHVLEADRDAPAVAGLAGTIRGLPGVGRLAALWLAASGTGPSGGRLVVAVTEAVAAGERR